LKRKYSQLEHQIGVLRKSHNAMEQLIHAIQSRSEEDAAAIFQRIREGADVESILQSIITGDLLLQLQVAPKRKYG
jgi:predicted  nucleic acid-binding Zn-ribbon protein